MPKTESKSPTSEAFEPTKPGTKSTPQPNPEPELPVGAPKEVPGIFNQSMPHPADDTVQEPEQPEQVKRKKRIKKS